MDSENLIRIRTLSGDDTKGSAGFGLPANSFKTVFKSIFGGLGLFILLQFLKAGFVFSLVVSAMPTILIYMFLKMFVAGKDPNYGSDTLQQWKHGDVYAPKNLNTKNVALYKEEK